MSILKNIVIDLKKELKLKKSIIPVSEYEKMSLFARNTISMSDSIKKNNFGIIAEFKRRSPSKMKLIINYLFMKFAETIKFLVQADYRY